MDSALRPRDIQARIRSGEDPESVAHVAGTTVERIMAFAAPVLAERAHVAQRAQRSSVRRRATEGGGTPTAARTLGDAVAARLRTLDVDAETVDWDAWRRDDGRWALSATYDTSERAGEGTFVFDAPGNYVQLEDDDARWLVGETLPDAPAASVAPAPRDDLSDARARRGRVSLVDEELPLVGEELALADEELALADEELALADEELALGEDAIGMVSTEALEDPPAPAADDAASDEQDGPAPAQGELAWPEAAPGAAKTDDQTLDLTETARRVRGDHPVAATAPPRGADHADVSSGPDEDPVDTGGDGGVEAASEADAQRQRRPRKGRGRASVPSWDEIMFGSASSD